MCMVDQRTFLLRLFASACSWPDVRTTSPQAWRSPKEVWIPHVGVYRRPTVTPDQNSRLGISQREETRRDRSPNVHHGDAAAGSRSMSSFPDLSRAPPPAPATQATAGFPPAGEIRHRLLFNHDQFWWPAAATRPLSALAAAAADNNVETIRRTEISHAIRMRNFHIEKSFHDLSPAQANKKPQTRFLAGWAPPVSLLRRKRSLMPMRPARAPAEGEIRTRATSPLEAYGPRQPPAAGESRASVGSASAPRRRREQ